MSEPVCHSWHFGGGVPNRPRGRQRALTPGERFDGRFEVRDVLGLGGMGVVYRAYDHSAGREVALKVLRGEIDDARRERLRREGELTAGLNHPGIVRIHSAGEVDGAPYLAYELVEGAALSWEDLDARALADRVAVLLEVARAVGYAHAHGIVHRDLKPDNVLIDGAGRARVTDFGLGWTQTLERLTQSGALVGTPRYMSPEQAIGAVDTIGPTCDVWALGVLLYRALTGGFPFDGERMVVLQAQVCQAEPEPPRSLNREVSYGMEAVCLKCLCKAPGDRYPDAEALAVDLANALESRPVSASTTSWWQAPRTRRRGSLLLAGLTVLVLGGLLATPALRAKAWEADVRATILQLEGGGPDEVVALELSEAADDGRWRALPADLRARGHLLLASQVAESPRERSDRVEHARRARALSPGDPAPGERALGRALMGLGEPREAASAFARARAAGAGAEVALEQITALLEAGDLDEVQACAAGLVKRPRWRDRALKIVVTGLLERGEVERASRIVNLVPASAHSEGGLLLCAAVERAAGGDPLAFLEGVASRNPARAPAVVAMVSLLLDEGEVEAAVWVAREARGRGVEDPHLDRLTAVLEACTSTPPRLKVLRAADRPWRSAVARWWLAQGELQVAFLQRATRPDAPPKDASLPETERVRRAQRAFEFALACDSSASVAYRAHVGQARLLAPLASARRALIAASLALRPGEVEPLCLLAEDRNAAGDPKGALAALEGVGVVARAWRQEVAWQRGRALLAQGKAGQAVPLLQDALGPERLDRRRCAVLLRALEEVGRSEEARVLRERIELLAGSRRAEAQTAFQRIVIARRLRTSGKITDMALAAGRVLELDPLHVGARYHLGLGLYMQGDREAGLRECLKVASASPPMLRQAQRMVLSGRIPEWALRESSLQFEDRDPLLQGFRAAMHVEQTGDARALPAAMKLMTRALREDPSEVVAWAVRGFLNVRARRFAQAERDLRVAREAASDCSVIPFYEALLLGAQGAAPEQVLALLLRARNLGYDLWHVSRWRPALYPELQPYMGVPGVEDIFKSARVSQEERLLSELRGAFDGFRDGGVRGWAFDPRTPNVPVAVRITADGPPGVGRIIGDARASLKRDDVLNVLGVQGKYGFKFPLPPWARGRLIHTAVVHPGGVGFTELGGSPRRWKTR